MAFRDRFITLLAISITLLSGMGIISCGKSGAARQLANADKVIENNPDSALRILAKVDTSVLEKARDKALYGLLITQAKVKIDATDIDTVLAGQSRKYFNENPEKDYSIRANYYSAYQLYLDSCYNQAIIWVTKAFLDSENLKEDLWVARCSDLTALILNNSNLPNESIK